MGLAFKQVEKKIYKTLKKLKKLNLFKFQFFIKIYFENIFIIIKYKKKYPNMNFFFKEIKFFS